MLPGASREEASQVPAGQASSAGPLATIENHAGTGRRTLGDFSGYTWLDLRLRASDVEFEGQSWLTIHRGGNQNIPNIIGEFDGNGQPVIE